MMNRVNKKLKQDTAKSSSGRSSNTNGSSIHSGHYMTSYLHDQNEDTVEMPIASPDAMNNDVTLNTISNTDQDNFHDTENEHPNQNSIINKSQVLVSDLSAKTSNNMTNVIAKKTMQGGPLAKVQGLISTNGSISGGLTLDRTNKSLKNLMFYIKSAYSNNLTSPKWKNFKGLKLQVTEKIRLNNVIWRSWFEQYGKKETSNLKLRLICQFANGLEEKPASQKMSKREGKFWRARLESITNEYKKWREISRKQIKACDSGENLKLKEIPRRPTPNIPQTNVNNTTTVAQLSSSFGEQTYLDNLQSNFNQQQNSQNHMYPPSNFTSINEFPNDFNVQSNLPTDSNFNSYGPNTPQNINSFNNFGIPSNSSFQVNNNYPSQANSVTTPSYSSQIPIASKQMPYNNRCRSPSPGLFDFDFNNFSSDTLFSTHFVEDPKDTIFGTNPDFFQPDLMHLFPNFDFFDLPGNNSDMFNLNNNNTETNSEQNSPQATSNTQIVSDSNTLIQTFNPQSTETVSVVEVEDVNKQVHQTQMSIAIDYSDLSNFDTLATVAAAQSINLSPNPPPTNRPIRQRHMSDISDFNHLKSASDQSILNDVNNHLKMPVSLSQINSSLSINPIQTQFSLSNTNISTQSLRRPSGSQIQSPQSNTSSNTIRNLLALNTPTMSLQPSISPPKQTSSSNMRISGILGVTGSGIPPVRKQVAPQKIIYQQEALPNLIQNSSSSPQQNIALLNSDNNKVKTDNLTISNLLTSSVIMPQQVKVQQDLNQMMNQQDQFIDQTKPPPSKRGRKSTIETSGSRSNSKTNLNKPSSQTKIKKDDLQPSQINGTLVMSETIENINSPTNSPNQKLPNYSSFQTSVQSYSNPDSNFSSYSNNKYCMPQSFSKESSYQTGRINRSDSLNSVNTETTISTAEQKRRCNIQQGFDRLQILVPALKDGKNLKVSKAVMLQKTSEYIKELQTAREKRMADLDVYRKEIDELSDKITECQNQLPANGVSVIGNLNKTEIFEQKFNSYVKDKTMSNWKFYLFSLILKPLFDNFITTVNTSSKEDMEKTFHEWQQKYCSLAQLRPIASNALRNLSRSTSILTDSSKLPEECFSSALSRI